MLGPAPRLVRLLLDTEVEVLPLVVAANGKTDGLLARGVTKSRPSCAAAAFKASVATIDGSRVHGTRRLEAEGMV